MIFSIYLPRREIMAVRHDVRGVTLVEMMVAVLVLSIGLLGIAGLQAATSKYKINTWARSSSSALLSDFSERVRINPGVAGTSFASAGVESVSAYALNQTWAIQQSDALTIAKNCETTACSTAERATFDLLTWRQLLRTKMPQGAAHIEGNSRNGFLVTMMWFDKENVDKDGVLQTAPVCAGNESGMAQQSCCPNTASAPAGVRCARFSFVP
jgi:type IV pilus assembly protein PilV